MSDASVDSDRIIQVMPDALANKIAAGEVVQRPASALKELIENAIDAGADEVNVVLKSAGSALIQVIDNGCGMSPQDAKACFDRHATSKIRSVEDLERIRTLGFRGEALASIAAVAQVELKTKRVEDDAGFRVRIDGSTIQATEPCATPSGTSVAARNLFYNVPARRNFLKTPATEFKHLVETFQFLALAHPAIAFTLHHDGNEVYRLTAAQDDDPQDALRHRIGELFGQEHTKNLIPAEETTSYLTIRGFVARPEFHRRSRGEQFLFVNDRYVQSRYLNHAIINAYEGLLPEGAYPFYALFLTIDPRHVDVNVHPTKAEVKFDDERGIYAFVKTVVKKALGSADLTPQLDASSASQPGGDPSVGRSSVETSSTQPRPFRPVSSGSSSSDPPAEPSRSGSSRSSFSVQRPSVSRPSRHEDLGALSERLYAPADGDDHDSGEREEQTLASGAMPEPHAEDEQLEEESLLWQLHNRYILTQIHSGLMILDQHAAHQRILYERALQSMKNGVGLSQQLLFPHTVDFNPADYELLKDLLDDLRSLGFDIELFSGRSAVIRGVPNDIRPGDERTILDDILQQYKSYRDASQLKERDRLAKSIARRSAIPVGKKLSAKEMRALIDQLFMCEMPYADPHGHPTIVKISTEELDKRFGHRD